MSATTSPNPGDSSAYAAILQQLNDGQKEAVDQIEGPVLVIAGPGTGKTHILAARIARILEITDAYPSNILCLTFTDAGVLAMRQRLLRIIGPDAHKVHIFTFHAFCNKVIRENLDIFGQQDLERCSAIEQSEIIRQLLLELPWESPLKKGMYDPFFYERHLSQLFRWMKMENWTAAHIAAAVEGYLSSLPGKPDFVYQVNRGNIKKGSPKTAKIAEVARRMEKLQAAADCFERYQKLLLEHKRYDYEDMILWVLRAFRQHPWLLQRYQEQYLYLLADEYQDTNSAQNELLTQLISYWDQPNVFIVGDDDQSIFEFQGARLQHFAEFFLRYQPWVKLVQLTENYRSSQHILDAAGALIRQNENRLVNQLGAATIQKQLLARHSSYATCPDLPRIFRFPNRFQETVWIMEAIRQLLAEGVPGSEIAVLFARHKQSEVLIRLFDNAGIAYFAKRPVNILKEMLFRQIRQLLHYFQLEWKQPGMGAPLLYEILHHEYWGISRKDIMALALAIREKDGADWQSLFDPGFLEETPAANSGSILQCLELLSGHTLALANQSLLHWFSSLLSRSGLLARQLKQPDKMQSVQLIKTLADFIQEQLRLEPSMDLEQLLQLFDKMEESGIALELVKIMDEGEGVRLLTAHSAKGLEFDHVFVMDCTRDYWETEGKSGQFQFNLPDTLTLSGQDDALEARRRLFYVACTRAGKSLTLTFSQADEQGKGLQPSTFVDEIAGLPELEIQDREISEQLALEAGILELAEPKILFPPDNFLERRLEAFALSPSSLQQYLECPLGFYYLYMLGIPVVPGESGVFGAVCHEVLQKVFERMKRSKDKTFPDTEGINELFHAAMERHRASFSAEGWQQYLDKGKAFLPAYITEKSPNWNKEVVLERVIHTASRRGVPISGTLDKIEFLPKNEVVLVDYKTGAPRKEHWRGPTPSKPFGANAWRQMLFYQVLYEAWDHRGHKIKEMLLSYLQPDALSGELADHTLQFSEEDKAWMEQLLAETDRKIRQKNFEGCGKSDCSWCTFTARYGQIQSLDNEESEWLDDLQ